MCGLVVNFIELLSSPNYIIRPNNLKYSALKSIYQTNYWDINKQLNSYINF